jgi:hypothetical protein
MGLIVPDTLEVEILTDKLNTPLTLRIFGNNYVPIGTIILANLTEIAGGGYVAKALTFANWVITSGDPSYALYNAQQTWTFTGPINAPFTIFGYYVTRNSDGKLMWVERFPVGLVPFTPINGSIIKVIPKFVAQSEF